MLSRNISASRKPLLPKESETASLSRAEKIELVTQCSIIIFFQCINGYYFITDEEVLTKDMALVYIGATIYSLLNSVVNIAQLYKLGPYLFNSAQLNENIDFIHTYFRDIAAHEEIIARETLQLKTYLDSLTPQQTSLKKNKGSRDLRELLKPKSARFHIKTTLKSAVMSCLETFSNLLNGFSAGLNLNQILKMGANHIFKFLAAPLSLGIANAAINKLLLELVNRDIFFLPSQLMMSRALDMTDSLKKTLTHLDEKTLPHVEQQIQELKRLAEYKEPAILPLEQKLQSTALIQFNIQRDIESGALLPTPKRSSCATFCLAASSLLPMLLSDLSVIFAAISEAEDKENNLFLYISISVITFIQLAAFIWRSGRYNDNAGIQALENFVVFSKESIADQIDEVKNSLHDDHKALDKMVMSFKK